MQDYFFPVTILSFFVDLLLLFGTNRLTGFPQQVLRTVLAAALGGVYAGLCLLPGTRFLGHVGWRIASLAVMSIVCFGMDSGALRRGVLFSLLCMAVGGLSMGPDGGGLLRVLLAALAVILLCHVGFRGKAGQMRYVPVTLAYGQKQLHLLALMDTGNMLTDPVSGEPVLIVGAEVARELLGLTPQQLANPVETIATAPIPGLRLIPYTTVGHGSMLLAMRLKYVRAGKRQGSTLVAFAPGGLDKEGVYQALIGGCV